MAYPSPGDIVRFRTTTVDPSGLGVYVELIDCQCKGFILASDYDRRRTPIIQLTNRIQYGRALRVDTIRGYVDVTRRDVPQVAPD